MLKRKLGHANGNSHELDEEDEETIESTQDRNRPVKQQKLTNGKLPTKQIQSESEGEEEEEEEDSSSSGEEDDDESMDSEEEAENIRQEQLLRAGITEPEAGVIENITLENFMCHRHFTLDFCSNVNFIAGENGSGKSAVLIALIVCLGAKASFTNRGSKLSDLVKAETNTATITVKLRNQGPEAYKPDKYGPSIIIERKINRSGTSGYKVRSSAGATISDKLNDVSLILEQFNIQIDNPMSILTQDTSRQFLNAAGPQDKYKSFLAATQLDKMTKDYTTIDQHINRISELLGQKNVVIEELTKKVREYQKEVKDLQHVVIIEKQINDFKNQLAWMFVIDIEREVKRKEIQVRNSEKTSLEGEIKKADEVINTTQVSIVNVQEEIKEFTEQIQQFEQKKESNNQEIIKIEREEASFQTTIQDLKKKKQVEVQRRQRQLQSIEEIKRRNAQLANNQSKLNEIDKKKQTEQQMEQRKEELVNEKEELLKERDEAKQNHQNQRNLLIHVEKEVRGLTDQLNNLKRSQTGDKYAGYYNGNNRDAESRYKDFLQKIETNKRAFSKPPIGPVGLHLKVKNEKWAYAIESAISKPILKNFLVFSIDDGTVLQKLARQSGVTIEHTKVPDTQEVYRLPEHDSLDPSIITILREIESPSHYVINFLIDTKKVEQIGLAHDRHEVDRLLYDNSRCPKGMTQMYDPKGNSYTKTHSGNQFFQSSKSEIGEATMFRGNSDAAIQRTQREIESKMPNFNQQKKIEAELSNNSQQIERKILENEKNQNAISRKILQLKNEIKSIEDTLVQQTDDTTDLEAGLTAFDELIIGFDEQIKQEMVTKSGIAQKKQPFIEDNRSHDDQANILRNQLNKIESSLRSFNDLLRKCNLRKQQLLQQQGKNAEEREQLKQELAKLQATLQERTEKASKVCERVDVPEKESNASLTSKIMNHTKQLENESKGKRSRTEALKAFTDANNSLKEITQQRDNIAKLAKILRKNLDDRYMKWQRFRLSIARRSNQFFNIFLSRKGYTGSLSFDHKAGKLDINVDLQKAMPTNQNQGVKGDTKGLSGGERSFSTVSLLLAFWENMECPFRAMDEFDVFMDEVNRSISINLLLSKAEENRSKQYIFVTPLALNNVDVKNKDNIRVFKVSPPVRGGNTLVSTS